MGFINYLLIVGPTLKRWGAATFERNLCAFELECRRFILPLEGQHVQGETLDNFFHKSFGSGATYSDLQVGCFAPL